MPETPASLTFDTNRLLFPTQRRFNTAWMELQGERLRVLPHVARELTHFRFDFRDAAATQEQLTDARERLDREQNQLTRKEHLLRAADLWWARALSDPASPYELVTLTAGQRERVEGLCAAFPPEYFPRTPREQVPEYGDAIIIAEALVTGQSLLLTGNMYSVLHHRINDWSERHQAFFELPTADVLRAQDQFMPEAFAGDAAAERLCGIALAAAWPDNPDAPMEVIEQQLRGALAAMHGARLGDTAICIAETWRLAPDPESIVRRVRARLPKRMRANEREHPAYPAARGTPGPDRGGNRSRAQGVAHGALEPQGNRRGPATVPGPAARGGSQER